MKINNISNTNFGIKLIKPEKWNKEVYENFINSNLAKDVDKKYPKATANYFLYKENDIVNDEPCHTILFDLNLQKDKIWHFWLNSHSENNLTKYLSTYLKELTLEKVESEIAKGTKEYRPITIDIQPVEKNPLKRFLKNFFN